ncbi:multiple resistance and pH regulation protein F [Thiocapsa imhoffii]|uniref:Multiple resistance and pH regulation protein F n=1 Tax=Thiocapsa imhoffii TaxID=382777 RepID=A0A9X1B9A0_9GAMM|nr:monovalent cation/H+ antiporter complex subunit F [Thiocapsa imhoffii]MBK1645739.1 multiple resistance and pH regulation protein F [Thiocapsa imhoffii]
MTDAILIVILILMASVAAGLVRVAIGPTPSDRMMAAQLMGTSGIAVVLLLANVVEVTALIDVALIFSLLAAIAVTAFTRRRVQDNEE